MDETECPKALRPTKAAGLFVCGVCAGKTARAKCVIQVFAGSAGAAQNRPCAGPLWPPPPRRRSSAAAQRLVSAAPRRVHNERFRESQASTFARPGRKRGTGRSPYHLGGDERTCMSVGAGGRRRKPLETFNGEWCLGSKNLRRLQSLGFRRLFCAEFIRLSQPPSPGAPGMYLAEDDRPPAATPIGAEGAGLTEKKAIPTRATRGNPRPPNPANPVIPAQAGIHGCAATPPPAFRRVTRTATRPARRSIRRQTDRGPRHAGPPLQTGPGPRAARPAAR